MVSGIGFVGGGVILARDGAIIGVTSAAVIWVLAALGSMIGLGHLVASIVLTVVTGLDYVRQAIVLRRRGIAERRAALEESEG